MNAAFAVRTLKTAGREVGGLFARRVEAVEDTVGQTRFFEDKKVRNEEVRCWFVQSSGERLWTGHVARLGGGQGIRVVVAVLECQD